MHSLILFGISVWDLLSSENFLHMEKYKSSLTKLASVWLRNKKSKYWLKQKHSDSKNIHEPKTTEDTVPQPILKIKYICPTPRTLPTGPFGQLQRIRTNWLTQRTSPAIYSLSTLEQVKDLFWSSGSDKWRETLNWNGNKMTTVIILCYQSVNSNILIFNFAFNLD